MNPFQITLINSIMLIIMGLWGYLSSENPSTTALIPVFTGVVLIILSKGVKNANKYAAHIVVLLTLLLIPAFIKPLIGSISRNDPAAIIRILLMMSTCIVALIIYIRSFIEVRKQRG